jgi:hypothetical protein
MASLPKTHVLTSHFLDQLCFSDIKYHLAFWNAKISHKNGTKTRNSADSKGENICKTLRRLK